MSSVPDSETVLFDFDANLTHDDLVQDAAAVMERAASVGVTEMLVPGATLDESEATIALCRQHPTNLFPTAGVHPYHAEALPTDAELERLRGMAAQQDVLAVGECGLDYSPSFPDAKWQKAWFTVQLELACELQKPLFLHERLAHADFLALISECQAKFNGYFPPAVVHCFTGTEDELLEYVRRDFYIGVTGYICKKDRGAALRDMLRHVPLNKLVIETDAPYMGFPKCRSVESADKKKQYPNVPSALPQVCEVVAQVLGKTPQDIAQITRANARRFLRLGV
ncbi:hypothetical protein Poli38472_008059 [Pythium oligandrum]|uniref:TatD related DNase n=1 Tax=Pythium oligandrum TaxID=41045 RepID=A0A8K1FN21_PYTOL|nr:hypothetical protein Poli38472_008059 [Pythium oligandrum]|eukprot:TMW65417.1 hypothetical protein Poli38472_008059 [Pythium oligandrum]